jgi:hypothetical protein
MVRTTSLLLTALLLSGTLAAPKLCAEAPADSAAPPVASAPREPDFLRTLPRPPDEPSSLLAPPSLAGPPPPPLPGPYFEEGPLTDPNRLPVPGWFADLDVGILKPHLKNQLSGSVLNPATGNVDTVGLPAASLDWTVSPHVQVGYRLPSGFGELSAGYRSLGSSGTDFVAGTDGPTQLRSRLDFQIIDLDYGSPEFSLWPHWELRARIGLRGLLVFFDSLATEPFDLAASGSGVFQTQTRNHFAGLGPHVGVDVARHLDWGGVTVLAQLDFTNEFGRIRQTYVERTTTLGGDGEPLTGQTLSSGSIATSIIFTRIGLSWQPPVWPGAHVFLGYQWEHWFDIGALKKDMTVGDFFDQGLVLRATWNY